MNKPLLAVACALASSALAAQHTLHVVPDGTGDGSSWSSPASLHSALLSADRGDALWLKAGTYVTSATGDRTASFRVPDGISLLGGFAGTEESASARNPASNPTILSGEIGKQVQHDNAFTIMEMVGVGKATRIDGLTFSGAYANGAGPTADARRAGGGVLVRLEQPGTQTAPVFSGCTFTDNYARDGGAVYIDARGGQANPEFINCTFASNEADLDGGAVYADARRRGLIAASFLDCTFDENVANYGGALFHQATKGECTPRLTGCTFRQNHAFVRGASLYNIEHQGRADVSLVNCVFEEVNVKSDEGELARGKD